MRAATITTPKVDESKIAATYSNLFGDESPNSFAAKVADAPGAAAAPGKAELPDFEQLLNGEAQSDARFEAQAYDLQPKKMVHASVSQKDSFDANKSLIKVRVGVGVCGVMCVVVYVLWVRVCMCLC